MKRLLLFFALCSSLGAWAQTSYGTDPNKVTLTPEGTVLTITCKGNVGEITSPTTTTYFTSSAVGNVFTSNTGDAVSTTTVYNPSTQYYSASIKFTQVFDGGKPDPNGNNYVNNVNTTKSWNESKVNIDGVYLYPVYAGNKTTSWSVGDKNVYPISDVTSANKWNFGEKHVYEVTHATWNGTYMFSEVQNGSKFESWNMGSITHDGTNYSKYAISNEPLSITQCDVSKFEENGLGFLTADQVNETYTKLTTTVKIAGSKIETGNTNVSTNKTTIGGVEYLYYAVSVNELELNSIVNVDDLVLLKEADLVSYTVTQTPIVINGERITTGNINGQIGTITVDGNTYAAYVIANKAIASSNSVPFGDPNVQVFTVDGLNEYINTTTTFTCGVSNLYVSHDNGATKSLLVNNTSYTYTEGDLYYLGGDATYSEIEDNEVYFAENSSYIKDEVTYSNIWPTIVAECNAKGYTELYFVSEVEKEYPTINNRVTQYLMGLTTVKVLDLSGVQIPEIGTGNLSLYDESNPAFDKATFAVLNPTADALVWEKNTSIEDIRLPHIKDAKVVNGVNHRHVPQYCCVNIGSQLKSVKMPDNATCLEHDAFQTGSGGFNISDVTFNETLERIGNNAFVGNYFKTLTFPASLEYIGHTVFSNGVNDIYFLGDEAPIVEKDAFDTKAYLNNNAIKDNDLPWDWYRIDRGAYVNADYMAAMLHLPKNMTKKQRAKYTDPTRDYHVMGYYGYTKVAEDVSTVEEAQVKYPLASAYEVVDGGVKLTYGDIASSDEDKEVLVVTDETDKKYVYYCSGSADGADFSATWGNASASGVNAVLGGGRLYGWAEVDGVSGVIWHNDSEANHYKQSGFYDKSVGMQYIWPSQVYMNRAFTVASNNKLWGGTMTIADGIASQTEDAIWETMALDDDEEEEETTETITVTYDTDCDGEADATYENGAEYMGLHEFILVTHDVNEGTTPDEYEFEIGGANWYTICVPFNMTVEQVRETFGETTQVCKFNNVIRDSEDMIHFYFQDEQCLGNEDLNATAIAANVPYMIRPSEALETDEYHFTLPDYEVVSQQVPERVSITTTDVSNKKLYTYTFVGQYNTASNGAPLYMPQYSYYLGAVKGNEAYHKLFIQKGEKGKWKPNTCVILASDGADDYATFFDPNRNQNTPAKGMVSAFGLDVYGNDKATSIMNYEVVCGAENGETVYNLNGQVVNPNKLQKGIYLKKGSKYIVK